MTNNNIINKTNYSKTTINRDFKNNLTDMIYENSHDHELFFVTFTFEDQFKQINDDIIIEYFKAFYQKLNQRTINNISRYKHLKSKMLLVPESSFDNTKGNMIKTQHYHGFVMINKQRTNGFYTKCVLNKQEYYRFNNSIKDFYRYESMIFHPDLVHQKIRAGLKTYTTNVQKIKTDRMNINSVCSYITKNLNGTGHNGFNACDALLFCNSSKLSFKNYKPRKRLNVRSLYIKTDDLDLSPFRRELKESTNQFLDQFYEERGLI